jgi:BlaI family transcriptional regulator, penicillinase repressor
MMARATVDRLGAREREIMNAIFALGNRASVDDILARLVEPPSYSTVRVMLTRLEKKGYLQHTQEGLKYVYSAVSPATAKRNALRQYAQTFFGGSLAQMVTALVRQGSWTREELEALKAEVERAQKERSDD